MILILQPLSVLSCFVLSAKRLFYKTILARLNANFTSKMIAIPSGCRTWSLVYSHDVVDTNANFNFLGIGEKLPPVLLRIQVALLNKYLNQYIKINDLFINIES